MKNILLIVFLVVTSVGFAQRNSLKTLHEKNGKIGIGTDAPDELLTVKGKIHTQEVLVDLEGAVAPDYVFQKYFEGNSTLDPDYKLKTLDELASFISKNHHLPGIPSAAELEKEGVLLKKMQLLLLEKIEELTLYTLEQQKEINTLKEQLSRGKE